MIRMSRGSVLLLVVLVACWSQYSQAFVVRSAETKEVVTEEKTEQVVTDQKGLIDDKLIADEVLVIESLADLDKVTDPELKAILEKHREAIKAALEGNEEARQLDKESILKSCEQPLKTGQLRAIFPKAWLSSWSKVKENYADDQPDCVINLTPLFREDKCGYRVNGELLLGEDVLAMPIEVADLLFAKYEHLPRVQGTFSHPNVGQVYRELEFPAASHTPIPLDDYFDFDAFELNCNVEGFSSYLSVVVSSKLLMEDVERLATARHSLLPNLYHVYAMCGDAGTAQPPSVSFPSGQGLAIEFCGRGKLAFGQVVAHRANNLLIRKKSSRCVLEQPDLTNEKRRKVLSQLQELEGEAETNGEIELYPVALWWYQACVHYLQDEDGLRQAPKPGKIPPREFYQETQPLNSAQWELLKSAFGALVDEIPCQVNRGAPGGRKSVESSSGTAISEDSSRTSVSSRVSVPPEPLPPRMSSSEDEALLVLQIQLLDNGEMTAKGADTLETIYLEILKRCGFPNDGHYRLCRVFKTATSQIVRDVHDKLKLPLSSLKRGDILTFTVKVADPSLHPPPQSVVVVDNHCSTNERSHVSGTSEELPSSSSPFGKFLHTFRMLAEKMVMLMETTTLWKPSGNSWRVGLRDEFSLPHVNATLQCMTHLKNIREIFLSENSRLFKDLQQRCAQKPATVEENAVVTEEVLFRLQYAENVCKLAYNFVKMLAEFYEGNEETVLHNDLLESLYALQPEVCDVERVDVATFFNTFVHFLNQFMQLAAAGDLITAVKLLDISKPCPTSSEEPGASILKTVFSISLSLGVQCCTLDCDYTHNTVNWRRVLSLLLPPTEPPFEFCLMPSVESWSNTVKPIKVFVFLDPKKIQVQDLLILIKNFMPKVPQAHWWPFARSGHSEVMEFVDQKCHLVHLHEKRLFFYESKEPITAFADVILAEERMFMVPIIQRFPAIPMPYPEAWHKIVHDHISRCCDYPVMAANSEYGDSSSTSAMKVKFTVKKIDKERIKAQFYNLRGAIPAQGAKKTASWWPAFRSKKTTFPTEVSLEDLLHEWSSTLTEGIEEIPLCPQCHSCDNLIPSLGATFMNWPEVLVVHCNKFPQSFTGFPAYRNAMKVVCPRQFRTDKIFGKHLHTSVAEYQLVAFVSENNGARFSASCRARVTLEPSKTHDWFEFKDDCVTFLPKLLTDDAVLLFYEKMETRERSTKGSSSHRRSETTLV